jgi:hypothetical protein
MDLVYAAADVVISRAGLLREFQSCVLWSKPFIYSFSNVAEIIKKMRNIVEKKEINVEGIRT